MLRLSIPVLQGHHADKESFRYVSFLSDAPLPASHAGMLVLLSYCRECQFKCPASLWIFTFA